MNTLNIVEPFSADKFNNVSQHAVMVMLELSRASAEERKQGSPFLAKRLGVTAEKLGALINELVKGDIVRIEKAGK